MKKERLDKFLSNQLNISRNDARTSVKNKEVLLNGGIVTNPAILIDPLSDTVLCAGKTVVFKRFIYLIMNKPAGIITASSDKTRKTVLDLVPENLRRRKLAPVGRLDKDTTGLLILTDDGDFAHKCISPKSKIQKSYIAQLDGSINEKIINQFNAGVVLADGYRCKPARLFDLGEGRVRIIITEGKYHQIKRMFGVFNLGVNSLHRESIGNLKLPENLRFGECVECEQLLDLITR